MSSSEEFLKAHFVKYMYTRRENHSIGGAKDTNFIYKIFM